MRESLMHSFGEISLLDLHGNYRKKETAPDGSKDENVFDIQQGVAINIMVKKNGKPTLVQRGDLYGKRDEKYDWLDNHRLQKNGYDELQPQSPFYFFKKQDYDLNEVYQTFIAVNELFPVNSAGIVTARDHFTIEWKKNSVWRKINRFKDLPEKEARALYELGDDTRDWKVKLAQEDIQESGPAKEKLSPILYRPFDKRFTYYTGNSRGFHCMPRSEVMNNMINGDNLAINYVRQQKSGDSWQHVLISNKITESCYISSQTSEICYASPLYLYPENNNENGNGNDSGKNGGGTTMMVFEEEEEYTSRRANINKEFYALLENTYGERPEPEKILYYTYAVLYAPAYRQKYAEFLKSDFPRVPFTKNYELFENLAELGGELTELHLMKSDKLNNPLAKFQGKGNNVVAKPKKIGRDYQPDEQRVYINKEKQYFEGISPELWEYQIGGYQVLDKWLYDRRERKLGNADIQHYCKAATALSLTIDLQKEIDALYAGVEEDVIEWRA
jgi:predicted helicase